MPKAMWGEGGAGLSIPEQGFSAGTVEGVKVGEEALKGVRLHAHPHLTSTAPRSKRADSAFPA